MNNAAFTSRLSVVFSLFQARLQNRYATARLVGDSPAAAHRMQLDARKDVSEFVSAADQVVAFYLRDTVGGALVDPFATERGQLFVRELRGIALDCMMQALRKLRGMDPSKLLQSRGSSAIDQLLRANADKLEFTARDGAGRIWKSADGLVAFLARDFAYQLDVDLTARRMRAAGEEKAQIVYPDPTHAGFGEVIDLVNLPLIRGRFFHPNSSARLASVPAQS